MNDNRKPGMFRDKNKLLDELHEMTTQAVFYWRHIADDEHASEGQLRDHLRQTANVVERLVESHKMQHEMIVGLRRMLWVSWGIVGMWSIAWIVRLL